MVLRASGIYDTPSDWIEKVHKYMFEGYRPPQSRLRIVVCSRLPLVVFGLL